MCSWKMSGWIYLWILARSEDLWQYKYSKCSLDTEWYSRVCNPGGHQYARAYLCNLKICQFNLFSKVEKFEYCISVANTAKSEHVLGRRKRKRIFLLFKESYLVRFLLSLRDNKIKWFKWDLKWQLQSSIYLFSAKNNESNCRFMGVKSNLVAILSTI